MRDLSSGLRPPSPEACPDLWGSGEGFEKVRTKFPSMEGWRGATGWSPGSKGRQQLAV